ncbi:beta-hexosaminidase 3-like [Papaver somniferum]|uniref:beta-hexosaminidase 3-like n=1 Tax=Papaver somniferum TaxID=3469 RepID=UPI000E6FBBC5|nr:beta-hexosaminidase 3-like [Papaver somniferum]XP_026432865.1 beta-hexosaminidase 3-like [Papaver somniferum]
MGEKRRNLIGGLFLVLLLSGCVSGDVGVNIWPMPKSVKYGGETLELSKDFGLETPGTNFSDHLGILKGGFLRLLDLVKAGHAIDASKKTADGPLKGLHIVISSPDDTLQYGIDESYNLYIPSNGDSVYAHLQAQTVYGALHGLQTFSQLCQFNFITKTIEVQQAPWSIADEPRFSYRGLLIDTSRHYLPLPTIKKVIDAMAYTKLNVLHWHIVDTQSFPLEIPSFPKLWNGAYSGVERYTMADAAEIVDYARRRGINILAEIDIPGHALSWGVGYPQLWPSRTCQQPLDVSNEFTFEVIDGILSDLSKVFNFKFVHLGGDEVNGSCWETTPHIKDWLHKHQMNASQAYEYFVLRAQKIALSHGYEIVNWEETFRNFGSKLNPKTVVHNWLDRVGGGLVQKAAAEGLRCIVSNQENWYLDHLDATWTQFYMNEPLTNITNPEHQKLVLGGEVCMWGETIDASDIEQTIWPRAAAAAERMWTPLDQLARHPRKVRGRLSRFRCLLNQRGVAAAPLSWLGRDVPAGPGSCYNQLYSYVVQKK